MKQDATRNAAYTVDCEDYVHVVEFNPFDSGDSGNLIAYGGGNYVVVGVCTFQEEETDIEGIQYKTLRTFQHGVRVDGIAWSPETRLDSLPPVIKFCTSAADMKIRLFTSDLQDKNEYKVLEGHSDFINGLVFDPKEGQEIASVSDDHTCRIWNLEGMQTAHFVLHSPGMSVCWHPEETFKVVIYNLHLFCILHVMNCFYNFYSLGWLLWVFPYRVSCHLQRETFDFFANLNTFDPFCRLIAVARILVLCLNNSGESGHPCRVPDLKGKASSFSPSE
uniref:Nucleoporin 37 n=1 Tax=Ursus americanus TaxID=9643 RepID=A0A452QUZ9_URSAM